MLYNGIQSYRRTSLLTTDPRKMVLMCYEGAIDQLKMAKQKTSEKEFEAKTKAFVKAQDIITELRCSLDFDKGGEIARNLDALYCYILKRLIHADINRDMKAADEAIGILGELRSAWEQAFCKSAASLDAQPQDRSEREVRVLGV
jgi:flagellar secretion chaperone FliS